MESNIAQFLRRHVQSIHVLMLVLVLSILQIVLGQSPDASPSVALQGETCDAGTSCAAGLSCGTLDSAPEGSPTSCLKLVGVGQECNGALAPAFAIHCESNLVCQLQEIIYNNETISSESGYVSNIIGVSGTCQKVLAEQGSPCDEDSPCQEGLVCGIIPGSDIEALTDTDTDMY